MYEDMNELDFKQLQKEIDEVLAPLEKNNYYINVNSPMENYLNKIEKRENGFTKYRKD